VVAFAESAAVDASGAAAPVESGAAHALQKLGFAVLPLGLAPAPERNAFYDSYSRTRFERHAQDDELSACSPSSSPSWRCRRRRARLPAARREHAVDYRLLHDVRRARASRR